MVNRCIVYGCGSVPRNEVANHTFPSDKKLHNAWKCFVSHTRGDWNQPSKFSTICSLHFTPDSFENKMKYDMGFGKTLILKKDAIPTIYPKVKCRTRGKGSSRGTDATETSIKPAARKRKVQQVCAAAETALQSAIRKKRKVPQYDTKKLKLKAEAVPTGNVSRNTLPLQEGSNPGQARCQPRIPKHKKSRSSVKKKQGKKLRSHSKMDANSTLKNIDSSRAQSMGHNRPTDGTDKHTHQDNDKNTEKNIDEIDKIADEEHIHGENLEASKQLLHIIQSGTAYGKQWNLSTDPIGYNKLKGIFPCEECGKSFFTKSYFDIHKETHYKVKCKDCEKYFIIKNNKPQKEESYTCKNCRRKDNCKKSNPSVHSAINFICEFCGKSFLRKSHLNTHIRFHHTQERNFACEICGKSFYTKSYLLTHNKYHTKEKDFNCKVCGKTFYKRYQLAHHVKAHTKGECVCSECGKAFTEMQQLISHQCLCIKCGMKCTCRSHLTSDDQYQCGRGNDDEERRHLNKRRFTRDGHFVCTYCGQAYSLRSSFVRHLNRKHNKMDDGKVLWKKNLLDSSSSEHEMCNEIESVEVQSYSVAQDDKKKLEEDLQALDPLDLERFPCGMEFQEIQESCPENSTMLQADNLVNTNSSSKMENISSCGTKDLLNEEWNKLESFAEDVSELEYFTEEVKNEIENFTEEVENKLENFTKEVKVDVDFMKCE